MKIKNFPLQLSKKLAGELFPGRSGLTLSPGCDRPKAVTEGVNPTNSSWTQTQGLWNHLALPAHPSGTLIPSNYLKALQYEPFTERKKRGERETLKWLIVTNLKTIQVNWFMSAVNIHVILQKQCQVFAWGIFKKHYVPNCSPNYRQIMQMTIFKNITLNQRGIENI